MLTFQSLLRAFRVRTPGYTDFNYSANTNADLSCDPNGSLYTVEALPPLTSLWDHVNYGANGIMHAGACILTQVAGYNDSAVAAYLLVFNSAVVPAPATAALQSFYCAPGAAFAWEPTNSGRRVGSGIVVAASSTPSTYTALAANFWVTAEGKLT